MHYLPELQRQKLFTLSDIELLTGNKLTAKAMLQSYKNAGYIVSIRRNMYAAVDLATKEVIASRYEIGSFINEGAYISHHSALECHGVANQVFYNTIVSSEERFAEFSCDGITYERCAPKITGGEITPPMTPLVTVTDIDRTVIDCMYDIQRAGGLEELLNAIRMIPVLHENKLLSYLEKYDQIFLWQKAGFILQHFARELNISESFFEKCRNRIHDRKKTLTNSEDNVYYPDWKLYAPRNLLGILDDGGDELV